jgi:hypothetical protein
MRPSRTILLAALITTAGCGFGEGDDVRRVPARGRVTLDGRPMAGARIAFMPEATNRDGTPGAAGAVADADGAYELAYRNRRGVAPGTYLVVIDAAPAAVFDPNGLPMPPRIPTPYGPAAAKEKGRSTALPVRGQFSATVPESGGSFDFNVRSSPPPPAGRPR